MSHRGRGQLAWIALLATLLPGFASAQPAAGEVLFRQRCAMCHAVLPGKVSSLAPNLAGVVGRKAASTAFAYSPAMKASNIVWSRATLDRYLTAPTKMVAGTRMVIAVADARQRALLIDYLTSVK
jgi:cytochrome c